MLLHHSTLLTMSFWSISLLCHMYELFEQLILHRLLTSVEQHLIDVQTGFSPGWSCPQDEQRFLPQWTRTNPAGKPTILCGTLWDIHLMVATKQQFTPRQCPGSNPSQHVHKQPTCVPGHNGLHLLASQSTMLSLYCLGHQLDWPTMNKPTFVPTLPTPRNAHSFWGQNINT